MKVIYKKLGKQKQVVNYYDVEKRVTTSKEITDEFVNVYGKFKRGASDNDFVRMTQADFLKYLKMRRIKKEDVVEELDLPADFEENENYDDIFGTPDKKGKEKING